MENLKAKLDQVRKDKMLLEEEEKKIEKRIKEGNIPTNVNVGQIYSITPNGSRERNYMVAAFGGSHGSVGLTCVGNNAGCYTNSLLADYLSKASVREVLVRNNAEYLGLFYDVFKEKD